MDSINRQQPEDNKKDIGGQEAVDRIRDVVKKTQTCFFCTGHAQGPSDGTRPMNVRQVDDAGRLWFLSADDSHKNLEIAADPVVTCTSRARSTPTSCAWPAAPASRATRRASRRCGSR
jgi:hypothetical protein